MTEKKLVEYLRKANGDFEAADTATIILKCLVTLLFIFMAERLATPNYRLVCFLGALGGVFNIFMSIYRSMTVPQNEGQREN